MNIQRIEKLKSYLDETPQDPFLIYALAMEYLQDLPEKAEEQLRILLKNHPEYLPSYYQLGLLQIEKGNPEEAIGILQKGIELARNQNNRHTLNELQMLLDEFQD
jgi:tetratricopeptide (TPR) repeat protein